VVSDDLVFPEIFIEVEGQGVDLPPCDFEVSPMELDFGRVGLSDELTKPVQFRNEGDEACLLFEPRIEPDPGVGVGVFRLEDAPIPPTLVEPGGTFIMEVTFAPNREGDVGGFLRVLVSNEDQPVIRIRLQGQGGDGLSLTCSQSVTIRVGDSAQVSAIAGSSGAVIRQAWSIASGPPGGVGTPGQWDPTPPTSPVARFTPVIVGVYELEHVAEDDEGRVATCTVEVTAEGRGLQVTLTWDGEGDVDLHLHNDQDTPWFTDDDCHYDNQSPQWDPADPTGLGANPRLDLDETQRDGPENIRIREPTVGETYTVAVDQFFGARGRIARVQLFCGRSAAPELDIRSRPLRGSGSIECSGNDFWKVAAVTFTSDVDCTVDLLDTYTTSDEACRSFD
jgi:hypothetical protein